MNRRVVPVLLLSSLSIPALSGANDPINGSLIDSRKAFVTAEREEDWAALKSNLWEVAQSGTAEKLADAYVRQVQINHKAGVVLLNESIQGIKIYREGGRQLAFIEVDRAYELPTDPQKPVSTRETVYAFLEKGQTRWQFNVLGCFSESHIKMFFPSYPSW